VIRTETTEKTGNYRVVSLPPGRYKVAAAAPGFSNEVHDGITLSVDQDARVDFALKTGSANQTITVTSDAPLLNTESGELGTTLNSQQVGDLPSFQRNILASLPLLSPGVGLARQQFDNDPPLRFSVNGGRALSEDLVVDGAEALSVNITAWGSFVPNQDAVQEMKFQTNAYAAENGRGTATVNIITKSGTNRFHGGLYDYLKNEDFNANDYFNKRNQLASGQPNRVSRLRDNLYGGDVSGPIWRDKLFFFLQYERHPVTNPGSTLSDVPTVAFKNGDFSSLVSQGVKIYDPETTVLNPAFNSAQPASASNPQYLRTPFPNNIIPASRFDPVAVAALKYLPDPNFGAPGAIFQNEFINTPSSGIGWQVDPRVDYAISEKQLLFFRLNHNSGTNYSGGKWPGNNPADNNHSTSKYPAWVGVLGHTYTFNNHLINDFRWGIERDISVISFPGSGQNYAAKLGVKNSNAENFPQFGFGVPNGGYGMGPGNALNQWEQTIQHADAVTYLHGKHAFKFGGDVRLNQVNKQTGRNTPSGAFGFSGFYTSNVYPGTSPTVSMADMLLGMVNNYNIQPADFVWGARKKEASWFVQDDWKLTRNLTVNLGLRQDLQFTWKEVQNRYTAFSPTLINPTNGLPGALVFGATGSNGTKLWNFAPRLGFAWTPFGDQKTVVRGGAGKFITPASPIEDYGDTGQGQETGYSASASQPQIAT
jgi:Carboxypeptidase regulatory-like domain